MDFLRRQSNPDEQSSIRLADNITLFFVILFAAWTPMAQLSILSGLSFKTLSTVFSLTLPLIFLFFILIKEKREGEGEADRSLLIMLILIGTVGAALSLFSIRPDADDVNYVSRSVFFLEHSTHSLDLLYHDHAPADFEFFNVLLIAQTIELFWAYLSYIFNVPFLHVYYFIVPVLGGFMIPLVWYALFSRFTENRLAALLGAAAVVASLCLAGDTHRSFGNFAFVRIWQGKALLMAVFIPLFVTYSIDFLGKRSAGNWSKLFLLNVAAIGLTKTALFIFPAAAISLGAGLLFSKGWGLPILKTFAAYFASLLYLILTGTACLPFAAKIASSKALNYGWPTDFTGAYGFVFGGVLSFSSLLFILSICASLVLLRGPARRFLAGWLAGVFVIFLNPLLSKFIAQHLTSANAYWRLFYISPFPLTAGLPVVVLLKDRLRSVKAASFILCALAALTVVLNITPNGFAVFNKVRFGFFRYKINRTVERDVKRMIAGLPEGPMLAPIRYSSVIPIFTSRLPQVVVRGFKLDYIAEASGRPEVAKERIEAALYVSGRGNRGPGSFAHLLAGPLRTVVLDSHMKDIKRAQSLLITGGFTLVDRTRSYMVYVREGLFLEGKSRADKVPKSPATSSCEGAYSCAS